MESKQHSRFDSSSSLLASLRSQNNTLSKLKKSQSLESANLQQKIKTLVQNEEILKKKIKTLERQLNNTKIFLNMVIHDMRNPANSIDHAIKQVLTILNLDGKKSMQKSFRKMTNSLQQIHSFEKIDKSLVEGRETPSHSNVDVTQKAQNIPKSINMLNFSGNFLQYKFFAAENKPLEEVKEGDNESVANSQSKNNDPSDIVVTENSPNSGTSRKPNAPFVMSPNSSQILLQQQKVPRTFIQVHNHQIPYEHSSRIKKPKRYSKMTQLNIDPNKCEHSNEYTPSIFRRSLKRMSQEELLSNGMYQKKEGTLQIPRNMFSFQQIDMRHSAQVKLNNNYQEGFDQDLFNGDYNMRLKLHQNGVLMRPDIKNELELQLKNAQFSSTMLKNLINDLMDLANIENSQFNLQASFFNLFETISHGLDVLDFQAQQKDIRLIHQYEEDQVGFFMKIYGDQNRYLQILLNFLSNAIKFTPRGGTITVESIVNQTQDIQSPAKMDPTATGTKTKFHSVVESQKSQRSRSLPDEFNIQKYGGDYDHLQQKYIDFEIRIQDSGYGISPENLAKLFMNFSKLEEHKSVNERGTGLGLSICKSLVELMGGSVQVDSKVGEGTTFIVKLKTKCQYMQHQEAIMIARQIEQQSKSRYSKNKDFMYQNMTSKVNNSNLSNAMQDLKQSQFGEFNVANLDEESKSEHLLNYFKSHQDKLDKAYNKNSFGSISPQPRKSDQFSLCNPIGKCLVANDNAFQLMIVSRILQDFNFEVDEAENGLVASQKALQTDYAFIILDLDMPIMNGYEACQRIKQKNSSEIINLFQINTQRSDHLMGPEKVPPIFALSAFINDQVIKDVKSVGFDDYIEAPFDVNKLQQKILPKLDLKKLHVDLMVTRSPFFKLQQTS